MSQVNQLPIEFDSILTDWKKINELVIAQNDNTTVDDIVATEQHNKTLEKLAIGLHLLRELKNQAQRSNIFIEALHPDSHIETYITAIKNLSDQDEFDDNYGDLQDACLLIEESLGELNSAEFLVVKADLLSAFNNWSLSGSFQETLPEPVVINSFVNVEHDDKPTFSKDENTQDDSFSSPFDFNDYITTIENHTNQLAEEGYSGLYSASLLLVETLTELNITGMSDIPLLLDNWVALINDYRQNSPAAIDGIMAILRHPDLNIPLDEDDFVAFTSLLVEEIGAKTHVTEEVQSFSIEEGKTADILVNANQHSEALEKLSLGLHLLQELKAVQGEKQHDDFFIEPLHEDSAIEDYICAIQELSEQAALNDDYDLQDVCLLLEDVLCKLPANELALAKSDIISTFNDWSPEVSKKAGIVIQPIEPLLQGDVTEYTHIEDTEPHSKTDIQEKLSLGLHLLREFKIAQGESEQNKISIKPLHINSSVEDFIQAIQMLSEQASLNYDYDLQDACLLIADTLRELSADEFVLVKSDLSAALNDYLSSDDQENLSEISAEILIDNEKIDAELNNEVNQDNNTETNNIPESEQFSEIQEKLSLGLYLLREFKIAQGELQQYKIAIKPLHTNSSTEDYIQAIQMLSEQALLNYDYDLQDACLLLEDTLRELSADDFVLAKSDLSAALNDYFSSDYQENLSEIATQIIADTESHDVDWSDQINQVENAEPEQHPSETLEKLTLGLHLLREFNLTQGESKQNTLLIKPLHIDSPAQDYIQAIQMLSEKAAHNDDYDLQDACFLLEDALSELTTDEFVLAKLDLSAALNDYLSADYQENLLEIAVEIIADTENNDAEPEQPSETLEKLTLGLHLLQEFKIAQGETQQISIAIESLHPDSTIDDYIKAIQKLSEHAVINDEYELQDACLLLEDALRELMPNEFADVKFDLLAVNDFISSDHHEKSPEQLPVEIIPDEQPSTSQISVQNSISTHHTFADYIANIERLGNQANEAGYSALHDVSVIIVCALHELSQQSENISVNSDLPALLDNWSALTNAYQQNKHSAVDGIMMVACHPDLNIALDEDDFAVLATLLVEEIEPRNNSVHTIDISFANIAIESVVSQETFDSVSLSSPDQANTSVDTNNESATLAITDSPAPATPNESITELADEDNEVSAALTATAQELVELLDTEAGLLNYRFLAVDFDEPVSERLENLQLASEELERLANASKMVGFEGLAEVCTHINANIAVFLQQIDNFNLEKRDLLTDWVSQVKAYLLAFSKKGAGKQLLAQMAHPNWVQPLTAEVSTVLLPQMQVKGLSDANPEEEVNEKIATDEDVSLALPDDVNKELLDLLLQELPGYTQQFSEAIQRLHAGGSSKDIDVAQRIAHTIKGSGNTVGIKGVAVLTHQIEDILMACAKAHKMPGVALINTLINASDCLEAMCESLLGFGEPPGDARAVLQEVLDWAYRIAKNGIEEANSQDAPHKHEASATTSSNDDSAAQPQKDTKTEQAESSQVAMVRVPTDQIENLFRLSSESIILNGQIYERQRRLKNQLQVMETQFALLQQLGAGLEQLIDLKDLSGRSLAKASKEFDALEMDQYNELHTASRRMVEAAVDARELSVDMKKELEYMNEVLEYQQRLVINTQEAVMQTRFVPVGSIVLRLQRGLRQTCRLTGKQGELTFSGESLLIDGDTLSALVEPLMHLLRNAIDHGLEDEEERIALGKPAVGQISIEFDREGNSILVRCRDDGRGLDFDAIRRTAEKRGDFKEGDVISEEELKRLILRPNFSTRNQLTQTSGRGVGMDVVNFQILSLGGSLSLHSVRGKGLTVELRMPLPLSRSHALIGYAAHFKVAISSKGLTQVIYSGTGELTTISNEQVLILGDEIYPTITLEDLLHVVDRRKARRPHNAVLLVQNEHKITAVLVHTIIDSREVVIKNLGYYMRKIHGFVGATILGDGTVTPVLDLPELLRTPVHTRTNIYTETPETPERVDIGTGIPRILIVDDSLSQRRALQQILTDAGFRVQAVRDGIEAVDWFVHSKPDIVITDLEMPRMNGIELASHIRSHANIRHIPIIMITSRSTQKHRQMAEEAGIDFYLIKPVQDDDLLTKIQTLVDRRRAAEAV